MSRPRVTHFVALTALSLVLASCMSHGRTDTALDVDAAIAAVTLGDDCAEEAGRFGGPGLVAGDCDDDGPCGYCNQTGVRLRIEAEAQGDAVPFEVLRVRMYTMDGELVEELDGRNPRLFGDEGYVDWDEMVEAGADLNVSYDLSAPDWSEIGGGDSWTTYSMSFRIEVDVRIDGVEETLEFSPASREPEVVT